MTQQVTRVTLVPLQHLHYELKDFLPLDLGNGFVVRHLSSLISQADLSLWNEYVSPEEQRRLRAASVCLEHTFRTTLDIGTDERESPHLLEYVVAHLRFLVPNKTNAEYILQATLVDSRLEPFSFVPAYYPIFLEDCEILCNEIQLHHLQALRKWIPWIVGFRKNWRSFYPLFLSLLFSEKAYREETPEVRLLLRVMALEALVSSETTFGKKALRDRLGKLIGMRTDLYSQYRNALQSGLPQLILEDLIGDVCDLRNKVAHGDQLPSDWLKQQRRQGTNKRLSYAEELREAATSMVSLAWRNILSSQLQETFADKPRMEAHFQPKP